MLKALAGATSAAALACVVAGCGGTGPSDGVGGAVAQADVQVSEHGSVDASARSRLVVVLRDDSFTPTLIRGRPGERLALVFENHGKATHNFTLANGHSVDRDVRAGRTASVTIAFPRNEAVSFFCKYHRNLGMAGVLQPQKAVAG